VQNWSVFDQCLTAAEQGNAAVKIGMQDGKLIIDAIMQQTHRHLLLATDHVFHLIHFSCTELGSV